LCVDIAVPRDFDPALAEIPSLVLYNVDDLEAVCAAKLEQREREVSGVEGIIEEGLADYRAWRGAQQVIPTIGALYQQAESIRRRELDRTLRRLTALSPEARDMIEVMTSSIVRRLLHNPVAALKARNGDPDARELARLTRELFALPSEESVTAHREPGERSP
jgi:glutamyl-tRNA reductase